jgi:hypothetical protein
MKSEHRKFGNKLYTHLGEFYGKTHAKEKAKKHREEGYNARVTPQKSRGSTGYYDIWLSKGKKK